MGFRLGTTHVTRSEKESPLRVVDGAKRVAQGNDQFQLILLHGLFFTGASARLSFRERFFRVRVHHSFWKMAVFREGFNRSSLPPFRYLVGFVQCVVAIPLSGSERRREYEKHNVRFPFLPRRLVYTVASRMNRESAIARRSNLRPNSVQQESSPHSSAPDIPERNASDPPQFQKRGQRGNSDVFRVQTARRKQTDGTRSLRCDYPSRFCLSRSRRYESVERGRSGADSASGFRARSVDPCCAKWKGKGYQDRHYVQPRHCSFRHFFSTNPCSWTV